MSSVLDAPRPAEVPCADISPKRRQMMEAAADLFIARGYEAVSMDAIARAANVSKATLYAHFASKDQLFATIVGDACRQKLEVSSLPDAPSDLRAALVTVGRGLLNFLMQPRTLAIHRVVIAEASRFPELGEAFYANGPAVSHQRMAQWMRAQHAAGRIDAPDPVLAAEQFMALLRTSLFLRATLGLHPAPTEAEIEATVEAGVETFLRAYGK